MINTDICAMRPGLIYTNTLIDTKSTTESIGLDRFMDLAVLVLQGRLVEFYI